MALLEQTGELVVERCWCGIQHAVPSSLIAIQKMQFNDGVKQQGIYCPLGHVWVRTGQTKADKLEQQLQRERASHDQTRADRDHKESQRRAEKGAKTRIKNRVANGVCPCCNRTFKNLARHMQGQHPEYVTKEGTDAISRP